MNSKGIELEFLATTALEEFWDTSKAILFLSDACRRYSRRSSWSPLRGEVLPCLWKDRQNFHDAYCYARGIYEAFLPALGEALNSIHEKKYGQRYWRILLGPWLFHYVPVLYDRYRHLHDAVRLYPGITSIVMSDDSFITPRDTADFYQLISDDPYNLQVHSKVFSYGLGKHFPSRKYDYGIRRLRRGSTIPIGPRLRDLAKRCFSYVNLRCGNRTSAVLVNPYFDFTQQLSLFMRSKGRVLILDKKNRPSSDRAINVVARADLSDALPGRDAFEMLLKQTIPFDLPQSFVEGYGILDEESRAGYPDAANLIGSAVSWYFQDDFKHWAASAAESGVKLAGIQHGGNYGSADYMVGEEHERAITDHYFSWGWSSPGDEGRVVPLPASKLAGRRCLGAKNSDKGILMAVTAVPRYLIRLQNLHSGDFPEYLRWQERFVSSLAPEIKETLRLRFRSEDYGQDLKERWRHAGCPEDCFDGWEVNFVESLKRCRLFVCGDLATIFVEALAADKPTILFWNPRMFSLRPEAVPYYKDLAQAGILFDNPETAAGAANAVYEDVEAWWNQPERQKVRGRFCSQFARTSEDALGVWAGQIERMHKAMAGKKCKT